MYQPKANAGSEKNEKLFFPETKLVLDLRFCVRNCKVLPVMGIGGSDSLEAAIRRVNNLGFPEGGSLCFEPPFRAQPFGFRKHRVQPFGLRRPLPLLSCLPLSCLSPLPFQLHPLSSPEGVFAFCSCNLLQPHLLMVFQNRTYVPDKVHIGWVELNVGEWLEEN